MGGLHSHTRWPRLVSSDNASYSNTTDSTITKFSVTELYTSQDLLSVFISLPRSVFKVENADATSLGRIDIPYLFWIDRTTSHIKFHLKFFEMRTFSYDNAYGSQVHFIISCHAH